MTVHAIDQPDFHAGGEPRRILWDDETGKVSGMHSKVPLLREWMADAVKDGFIVLDEGWLDLPDPRREPAQFLAVLHLTIMARYDPGGLPPGVVAQKRPFASFAAFRRRRSLRAFVVECKPMCGVRAARPVDRDA